jgi:hypothetical protein
MDLHHRRLQVLVVLVAGGAPVAASSKPLTPVHQSMDLYVFSHSWSLLGRRHHHHSSLFSFTCSTPAVAVTVSLDMIIVRKLKGSKILVAKSLVTLGR